MVLPGITFSFSLLNNYFYESLNGEQCSVSIYSMSKSHYGNGCSQVAYMSPDGSSVMVMGKNAHVNYIII